MVFYIKYNNDTSYRLQLSLSTLLLLSCYYYYLYEQLGLVKAPFMWCKVEQLIVLFYLR